ncbi:hypothetical protein EDEG_03291 [Edhazardia aedis USNM 41457]|uniref:Uncharacterized protein n=1 Tax=Edhazardia aedis (strain USNM 41457) TaxID=1003232 RepID=J9DLM7_EDHAE|nr:hypothetical protein EDEG_03291 [Edhazardia aedis USNM 41457]|eukprot:EJW02267.1 hypothetical protein EDEG_03291 [Edhazardia aedis USNM 41457]
MEYRRAINTITFITLTLFRWLLGLYFATKWYLTDDINYSELTPKIYTHLYPQFIFNICIHIFSFFIIKNITDIFLRVTFDRKALFLKFRICAIILIFEALYSLYVWISIEFEGLKKHKMQELVFDSRIYFIIAGLLNSLIFSNLCLLHPDIFNFKRRSEIKRMSNL